MKPFGLVKRLVHISLREGPMSGQTITVVGCVVSFGLLFGIYMSLRGDFLIKMRDNRDSDDQLDGPAPGDQD